MQRFIGVAVTDLMMRDEWTHAVQRAGRVPVSVDVQESAPTDVFVAAYLVALDTRRAPVPYGFWLATLNAPIILVTPHILAAQTLCRRVPRLAIICHPTLAAAHLMDYLTMAPGIVAGTLVVEDDQACHPHVPWRGVA